MIWLRMWPEWIKISLFFGEYHRVIENIAGAGTRIDKFYWHAPTVVSKEPAKGQMLTEKNATWTLVDNVIQPYELACYVSLVGYENHNLDLTQDRYLSGV